MGQVAMCNMKGVAHCDTPTENYQQICSFPVMLGEFWLVLVHLFGFTACSITVLAVSSCSHPPCLQQQQPNV